MKIKIWYLPHDCGDGSVSVRFFSSEEKLKAYQEAEEKSEYYVGFGEDCSGTLELEVGTEGEILSPNWNFDTVYGG